MENYPKGSLDGLSSLPLSHKLQEKTALLGKNKMMAGFFSLALAVLAGISIFSYLHNHPDPLFPQMPARQIEQFGGARAIPSFLPLALEAIENRINQEGQKEKRNV
jgi:hypothetical protein